ncbi:MAG: patatin [Winogradskyella sp.]|uniref:patatin-like phospholipase family protein n=1 Tax=Winogradskyella sp. TaxID=1883156 RepID=UPI000F3B0CF0|nr:patatin-like phospholipase family protein [Winogradskyella sp.]RNC88410.1 MAG: patatin [Winogradskyella sp.]
MAFLLLGSASLNAQSNQEPKVGLVLSGGGAKGFAHIGTLKVIDSLGIKIDYIAGTSMGAIIGSLYASGYSGKQLDSIFKSIDFDALINDKFSRNSKSLVERNNSERYALSLPFQKFKVKLPSGLSRGQNVYNLLYKLMLPVNEISDFESLPIPFFCIATNIETGEPEMMNKGNLAEAVLASGAFPSLFQPVEINNSIYIDGGVTNNYPIEELRAKGMDIIIGVDVQDGLKDREALQSAPEILVQINNFRTINDMKVKRKLTDIYIKPDITNFSVISFSEGRDIVKTGEVAAKERLKELVQLKEKQSASIERSVPKIKDSLKIRQINLSGNERYTRSYILGKLKLKGDDNIAYSKLDKGVNNLVATNNFDTFRYKLKPVPNTDEYDLEAKIRETNTSTYLKLGVHYDGLYKSAALVNLTQKRLISKNDIASLDIGLGDNIRYDFNYFIDKGFYVSIGLSSRYNQFDRRVNANLVLQPNNPLLTSLNKVDVELQDQTNRIYFQTLLAKEFEIKSGFEHKRLKITTENLNSTNQSDFTFENTDYFSLYGGLKIDTYDNRFFPNNGVWFNGDIHWYIGASGFNTDFEPFSIAKADIGYAVSPLDKLSLHFQTSGGFQLGDRSTNFLNFAFGGYGYNFINNFNSFYGYDYLSIVGNSFVKADVTIDYEIFKKHHIMLSGNFANIQDNIFDDGEWFSSPDFTGYALGYSLETFLGPIEAKYTYSPEEKESYWFFNLGFWF